MPLTFTQGAEGNVYNSLKDYINTNIVVPYNAAVSGGPFPNPLGIELEMPADPLKSPTLPVVVFSKITDYRGAETLGLGGGGVYRYETIRFFVYPSLTSDGVASNTAESILRNYFWYAFGTGLMIPINDYTQNPAVQVEALEILESKIVTPSDKRDSTLDIETNRFDCLVNFRLSYITING